MAQNFPLPWNQPRQQATRETKNTPGESARYAHTAAGVPMSALIGRAAKNMTALPASPSAEKRASARRKSARERAVSPAASACATTRASAAGTPADERVSSSTKSGYTSWYTPAPSPPSAFISGTR